MKCSLSQGGFETVIFFFNDFLQFVCLQFVTSLPVQQLNRVMETVTNRKRGNSDYDSGLATFEG